MDEEVNLGKEADLKRNHDITNGASGRQKRNIGYSFREECKQIFSLAYRHSLLYIVKFLFLAFIATVVACVEAESYHSLIVSSFTLLSGLLFDQLGKKKIAENFDFKRAELFCDIMTLYIIVLFLGSILLLILEKRVFPNGGASVNICLNEFKWLIFLYCFLRLLVH